MNYALTETNGGKKNSPIQATTCLLCHALYKGPVKGYHFGGPLTECVNVCNEHYSLQQIPNTFAEGAT